MFFIIVDIKFFMILDYKIRILGKYVLDEFFKIIF